MILFVIFAILLATILLSIVLERVLHSPFLVAITFFSIYLIILAILFAIGVITDLAIGLIAIIVFTIVAFITAVIVRFIRCICRRFLGDCCNICPGNSRSDNDRRENRSSSDGSLLTISCRCNNGNSEDLLSINSNCLDSGNDDDDDDSGCSCGSNISTVDNRSQFNSKCNIKSIR